MMVWLLSVLILTKDMVALMSQFLSMKLATVNPELNIDMEQILSKDVSLDHHIAELDQQYNMLCSYDC